MKDNTMKITIITTLLDAICIGVAYYFATELKETGAGTFACTRNLG